jgi:hypothetical protein
LTNLSNPELLYWSNNTFTPEVGLVINGTPSFPQVVNYAVQSIPDDKSSLLKAEVLDSNDSLFSVSFDGGTTPTILMPFETSLLRQTSAISGIPINKILFLYFLSAISSSSFLIISKKLLLF